MSTHPSFYFLGLKEWLVAMAVTSVGLFGLTWFELLPVWRLFNRHLPAALAGCALVTLAVGHAIRFYKGTPKQDSREQRLARLGRAALVSLALAYGLMLLQVFHPRTDGWPTFLYVGLSLAAAINLVMINTISTSTACLKRADGRWMFLYGLGLLFLIAHFLFYLVLALAENGAPMITWHEMLSLGMIAGTGFAVFLMMFLAWAMHVDPFRNIQ